MQLVNIIKLPKLKTLLCLFCALPFFAVAQENSPYSRYGLGNLVPKGNLQNRAMGGISAGVSDPTVINFINPASYGSLVYTTLDLGLEVDSRTLKNTTPVQKFTANNAILSYLQLAFPFLNGNKKALKNHISLTGTFGLRPLSKVNYKIQSTTRLQGIDTLGTINEGSGGANLAYVGSAIRIKNFSIGFNAGYYFGSKNYSTRLQFLNDTISYAKSNSATNTNFGGGYLEGGIQYSVKAGDGFLKFGGYGNLSQHITTTQDVVRETYAYNSAGAQVTIDSIYTKGGVKGTMTLPASFGVGFILEKPHFQFGLDYEATSWNSYKMNGQSDFVKNTWMVKAGFQLMPARLNSSKYWDFVKYRAGGFYGKNYININGNMPEMGLTAGLGLPLRLKRTFYETQYSLMNVAVEYNAIGNTSNNLHENVLRIGVGFSLSDIWFRRQKFY